MVADSVEPESPVGWLSRHNAAGTTQLLTGRPWVGTSSDTWRHTTPRRPGLGTSSDTWRQTTFSWRYTKADLNAYLHRPAAHKPLNPAA